MTDLRVVAGVSAPAAPGHKGRKSRSRSRSRSKKH
jgi:hypothetical protein